MLATCVFSLSSVNLFRFRQDFFFFREELAHYHIILRKEPFGNIVGKGENAGIQHFLLFFSQYSLVHLIQIQ